MSLTALRSIINATLLTIATFITSAAATADEAPQQQVDYAQHPAVEAADQSPGEKQDLVPSLADPPPLPTIEDIQRGNHFDWLITKDDKILVVRPVEPRPDTLAKIAAEVENLMAERGGLTAARQKRQQRLEELQSLTVELFDQPSTKYKIKVDQIREIRHFEDLVQQRAEELKRLENTISEGEELLAAFRAPVDAERKAVSTTLFDKSALTRCDLHVVGMYMPRDHHHDDRVFVDVKATGKPMVLVLTGYFGAEWHLKIDPQADVRQVIVPGYYKHEMAEPKPECPVTFLTYFPNADKQNRNYFWAYAWHTAEGRELRRRLNELTGLEVTTFQGEYAATRFVIDGTRGRDVVTGKTNGNERPSGLGGWFQNLIGSSDTDDRPPLPQPPVDDSSTNQPNTETSKPVIRTQLEAAREQAEAVHRDAEQASLQAAHDYRDELSQASPDKKALADRRQRLHQAVKAAFEAQMQLQQIRLQLAQLDLAEVKAKHQQRQTLAEKIIERRVADLMSGEDLEWPQAAAQRSETNATVSAPRNNDGKQAAESDQQLGGIQADPELDGEWVMLDYSGPGIVAHRERVRVMTSVGKWKLVDQTVLEINCERILDRESVPAKIDLIPLDTSNVPVSRGIYRVEGDTLTIAWAPHIVGVAPRPTDFSGKTGIVQTLKRVTPVPKFATPQELVDYVTRLNAEASEDEVATMDQMFDLVTDDEINRFAGLMLRTTSMMQMAAGLGAAFGNSDGSDGNDQRQQVAAFLQAVGRMNLIVDKYRHKNPAPEALAAYQEIAGGLNLSMLFQGGAPTTTVGVEKYSQKLRLAAGVLNDPKAFLSEILKEMQTIEATQSAATGKESDSKVKPDWQVTVNGDSAFAIDRSAKPEASNTLNLTGTTQRMDLIKVGDTWKISSLIPDNVIIEMQQGPTVTESSSPASAPPGMQPSYQPASSAPTYAPVETYSGVMSATAAQALQPFTELNSSNVCNNHVVLDSDKQKAIDVSSVQGRYINRPLEPGEMITADMLMDKPTTEQVIEYWLNEAIAGREVFESMRSLQQKYHRSYLYAMEFPFSASYARRFNDKLPDWAPDYLQAAANRLEEGEPVDWSQEKINILQSLGELVHYQTVNEKHKLATIGERLTRFVSSDFRPLSGDLTDVGKASNAANSSWLLGELVRITGRLPDKVMSSQPLHDAVVAKLQLLETMVQNSADNTWISQERRRLFGLAEEAPGQALKLLLTSKPISNQGLLESWMFALSSEETYGAWRSAGNEHFAPPLDPVVAIAVAELLVGKDEVTDNNLALLFQQHHPGYMFARHLDDLLSSELAYRDSVLQLLVSIYSKSKSPQLKENLAKMAPSVAVRAGD